MDQSLFLCLVVKDLEFISSVNFDTPSKEYQELSQKKSMNDQGNVMPKEKKIIGWREWVKLPDLNIPFIKAKVDTGARTSSLHAFDLKTYKRRGQDYVAFTVYPEQRTKKPSIRVEAKVHEYRNVKSSTGHQSKRPVIITTLELHGETWPIEVTLANRDEMGFRMLLGRESFRGRVLIDAGKSYYSEKPKKKKKKTKKIVKKKSY